MHGTLTSALASYEPPHLCRISEPIGENMTRLSPGGCGCLARMRCVPHLLARSVLIAPVLCFCLCLVVSCSYHHLAYDRGRPVIQ
jgi:hypothetical protein